MKVYVLCCALFLSSAAAQSTETAASDRAPQNMPYTLRDAPRTVGNVGGWWHLLDDNEKVAFLDGYQSAMKQSLQRSEALCKVLKNSVKPSSDNEAFMTQVATATSVYMQNAELADFEKVTTKDLDDFYADPTNQPIGLRFSMGYLRDKASSRKTEGESLDALKAEQKDAHDCSKHPYSCRLGTEASRTSK